MVLHPRIEAAGADMSLIETRTPGRSPWKFPRDADALIDYFERWEGSRPRLPARPRASPHALSAPQPESASWGEEGQAKRQVLFGERMIAAFERTAAEHKSFDFRLLRRDWPLLEAWEKRRV